MSSINQMNMPLFSEKQIEHAHDIITTEWADINKLANAMDCNIRDAWQLLKLVKQKYPAMVKGSKPVKVKAGMVRPPAEYSNNRTYDLI